MGRPFKNQPKSYSVYKCEICGLDFTSRLTDDYIENHPRARSRFCTKKCMYAWRRSTRIEVACEVCGKARTIFPSDLKLGRGKYCSKRCGGIAYGDSYSGENNFHYRKGSAEERLKIRNSAEYIAWRTAVFIRDNRTCLWCGSTEKIEADHIKPKSAYPELIFDIDNGRTLCHKCHIKTPTYARSLTREQYEAMRL